MTTTPEEPAVEPDPESATEAGGEPGAERRTGEPDPESATQANDAEPFASDDPEAR